MDMTPEDMMMMGTLPYVEPDPTTFGTLVCWVEARKLVGLSNGDPVTSFTDQSGAGNHLTSSGTARPAYLTGQINGLPAISFTNTIQQYLAKAVVAGLNQPHTRIFLARLDTYEINKTLLSGGTNPNESDFLVSGPNTMRLNCGSAVERAYTWAGAWFLTSYVANGAATIWRLNGVQSTVSAGTTTPAGITLGNTPYHITGAICSVAAFLQYQGDVSANLVAIETWLKTVYGLP